MSLVTQIFIAFVIAIILGVVFGSAIDVIQPIGELFLRLIKFIIAPLILATLVVGVSSSDDPRQLRRMGIKTVTSYLVTTGIASIIGLAVAFALTRCKGVNIPVTDTETAEE